jgi:NADPH:quinone reductase-like Zn-dependent oxidoreductase
LKAIVVEQAGPPDVLTVRDWPKPEPKPGWVLIRVQAFGLNRSEMFTRQGHSPSVKFPRVLGIECVGIVEAAPGGEVKPGQKVAAVMGGMGREFDGGYAEYALVPASQALPVSTELDWATLGALPETYLTAARSLDEGLDARAGEWLLIRGGSSSVGMAAIVLAKDRGMRVIATTRNAAKSGALKRIGADHVVIDGGSVAGAVRAIVPDGVERALELVGTVTLRDSLRAMRRKGTLCVAGLLGNEWTLKEFSPLVDLPNTVRLSMYTTHDLNRANATETLQRIVDRVRTGRIAPNIDRTFRFDEIVAAHRYMESNAATGKLVVLGPASA